MKVEMNSYILLVVSCIFLVTSVAAEDEATTAASDNVETENTPPENVPESQPQSPTETKSENNDSNPPGELATEGSINFAQENVKSEPKEELKVSEAKLAEEEKVTEYTTAGKEDATTAANEKDNEIATGENDTATPALEEGVHPTVEKVLLKTLSGMTDQDKVRELFDEKKTADIAEAKGKPEEIKIPDLKEDKLETETKIEPEENKDQEQQEINFVFATDLVKKDDEFERMAKKIKPSKELDEALAKKLAGDWSEHMDHNKEDEQPNIVFESQENNGKNKKIVELEEKIEPESEITDDDSKTETKEVKKAKSKYNKDVRMALPPPGTEKQTGKETIKPPGGKQEKTATTSPLEITVLDESVENAEEKRTNKSSIKREKGHKGKKSDQMGAIDEIKNAEESKEKSSTVPKAKESPEEKTKKSIPTETTKENHSNESLHGSEKTQEHKIKINTSSSQEDHGSKEKPEISESKEKKKIGKIPNEKTSTLTTIEKENIKQTVVNKHVKETENIVDPNKKENSLLNANKIDTSTVAGTSKKVSSKDKKMAAKLKKAKAKESKSANKIDTSTDVSTSKVSSKIKDKKKAAKQVTEKNTSSNLKPASKTSKEAVKIKDHEMSEEDLMKHAKKFENLQSTTDLPGPKIPLSPDNNTEGKQTKPEDDGTNVNTTLVFAEIIFRHGDRYKGEDQDETYPNDPYAVEDPFWQPYGCNQLRNKGKMRSFWLGQYLRKRYNGFLGEEYYHNDVRFTSADLNRCIDSAHVVGTGLYPPKGINMWNDNVGRYYQPLPVRTLDPAEDIYLNEDVKCVPYEKELMKVLNKKMKNFNKKYKYVYEYLEMYAGMRVRNLEDVAQIYTTLRIENENGRKLPGWVNLVFPNQLKMLNSYYNQIRFSSHFFKRIQAGPLLTIILDELKQKSINRLKPNYKMKFWSGFDTTILKLLYTMKETQASLDKAEDLLETDYGGVLMIEMHLINKKHYVKVLYINMDPLFFKSHAPRSVKICDGLSLCPLETFLEKMEKYKITQEQWYHACNLTYC